MATIEQAKQAAAAEFLSAAPSTAIHALAISTKPQQIVTGIGRGPKIENGVETGEECLRFYVEQKLPKEAIPQGNLLPELYHGIPTDVIESGRFRAGAGARAGVMAVSPGPVRTRLRPTAPGCSIGFQFTGAEAGLVMAGTYGAVVTDGTQFFILSNNHVLANENSLPIGAPIFQPGLLDGGNPATDEVAVLARFVPLTLAAHNLVDCAIAQLNNPAQASAVLLPNVGKLASSAVVVPALGATVEKVGRTTGYTQGAIFDASATVKVTYEMGTLVFDNQVLIRGNDAPFSDSGDSGSLIVDMQTKQGTALLFAGSDVMTIGNALANVLAALGVSLVV